MFGLGRKFACYSGLAIVTFVFATSCDPSGSSGDRQEAVRINEVMARNRSTVVVDDLGRLIVQDWVVQLGDDSVDGEASESISDLVCHETTEFLLRSVDRTASVGLVL